MKLVSLVLAASVGLLTACDAPAPGEAPPTSPKKPPEITEPSHVPASTSTPAFTDETDEIMSASAATACVNRDFHALFDAMVTSAAVRRAYSAPQITISTWAAGRREDSQVVDAAAYDRFPVIMRDYYRLPAPSVTGVRPDEYVILTINQGQNENVGIEWTRVTYDGQSAGGDDLGNAFLLDGRPYEAGLHADGKLLLRATASCWELVSDDRYLLRSGVAAR